MSDEKSAKKTSSTGSVDGYVASETTPKKVSDPEATEKATAKAVVEVTKADVATFISIKKAYWEACATEKEAICEYENAGKAFWKALKKLSEVATTEAATEASNAEDELDLKMAAKNAASMAVHDAKKSLVKFNVTSQAACKVAVKSTVDEASPNITDSTAICAFWDLMVAYHGAEKKAAQPVANSSSVMDVSGSTLSSDSSMSS